jgi:hypothetical protein
LAWWHGLDEDDERHSDKWTRSRHTSATDGGFGSANRRQLARTAGQPKKAWRPFIDLFNSFTRQALCFTADLPGGSLEWPP